MDIPTQIGLQIGAIGKEVGRLQNYLKTFGFILPDEETPFGFKIDLTKAIAQPKLNTFDAKTKEALKRFQEFYRLPITGVLDKNTINLMLKPRCGVPDVLSSVGEVQDYVNSGKKWGRKNLTYNIEKFTTDFNSAIATRAIKDAFDEWSSVAPLQFTEVTSGADIKLSWETRNHGDGNLNAFDGPQGILAHAFPPEDGRVHFDDDEVWTDNILSLGVDFASIVLHELGHALGLGHSNDPFAVMYAIYMGRRRKLNSDDIAGIRSIYGTKQNRIPV